ncbi:MAG: PDZ domain-containing protein, partial [Pirellulales bacterium]
MRFSFAATIATIAFIASPALAAEPFLGLFLDPNLPPGRGQPVAEITPGGPAEAAGIRQDDRLLSVDGFPIQRATDVGRALQGTHPGERIRVEVERRGRLLRFEVRLGDRQAETEPNRFQAQNEPAEPPPANKYVGVVVILPTERDLEQLKAPARFTRGALVLEVL